MGGGGEGEAVDWTCVTFVSKTKDVDAWGDWGGKGGGGEGERMGSVMLFSTCHVFGMGKKEINKLN